MIGVIDLLPFELLQKDRNHEQIEDVRLYDHSEWMKRLVTCFDNEWLIE